MLCLFVIPPRLFLIFLFFFSFSFLIVSPFLSPSYPSPCRRRESAAGFLLSSWAFGVPIQEETRARVYTLHSWLSGCLLIRLPLVSSSERPGSYALGVRFVS